MRFLGKVDANSTGVITLNTSGTPSSSVGDGALAVDTVNDKLFIRSGGVWVEVVSGSGVTDHGALTGLGDDDHTQYLLADGTRTATSLTVSGDVAVNGGDLTTTAATFNFAEGATTINIGSVLGTSNIYLDADSWIIGDLDVTNGLSVGFADAFTVHPIDGSITTAGDLTVSGNVTVDTNTFKVDATNNRIGVGTATPSHQVHVSSTGTDAVVVTQRTDGVTAFLEGQATRGVVGTAGTNPLGFAYNDAVVVTIGAGGAITVNPDGASPFTLPTADGSSNQVLTTNGSGTVSWQTPSGGGGSVDVSDTPPTSPSAADLWYESDTGNFYIYYDSQWVEVGSGGVSDHGGLTGLGDDDHTQYLLADGTRTAASLTVSGDLTVDSGTLSVDAATNTVLAGASTGGTIRVWQDSTSGVSAIQVTERTGSNPPTNAPTTGAEMRYDGISNRTSIGVYNGSTTFREDIGIIRATATTGQVEFPTGIAGDVGIGTNSPAYPLHVWGTSTNNPNPRIAVRHAGTPGQAGIVLQSDGSGGRAYDIVSGDATYTHGGALHVVENVAGHLMSLKALSTNRGALGIGTTSASEALDVVGNAEINGNIIVTGTVDGRDVAADGAKLDGLPGTEINTTVTTTTDTLAAGDKWKLTQYSNASQVTVTVPTGTFSAGDWFMLQSTGAGGLTLSTTGLTVNGANTTIAQSEGMMVVFTASNTISVFGGTS